MDVKYVGVGLASVGKEPQHDTFDLGIANSSFSASTFSSFGNRVSPQLSWMAWGVWSSKARPSYSQHTRPIHL